MESNLEQVTASALSDLAGFDFDLLAELYKCDVPSPTLSSSSDGFSVDSLTSAPGADESSFSAASSPASPPQLLSAASSTDSLSSDGSPPHSKHRSTRCRTPHCIKKEHVSIQKRNARERNRVKLVSDGFANLRKHVPTSPINKKLSKVETLRTAIEYIKYLQRVLNENRKLERERRLMQQVGWISAEVSPGYRRLPETLPEPMNSILMELPEIAPYPAQLHHHTTPGFPRHNSVSLPANQFQ